MNGPQDLYALLEKLEIPYEYHEHPEAPTIEIAQQYWKTVPGMHCKNIFLRNHKGSKHFLVCFDCQRQLDIHGLEKNLKQGKLSFASESRLERYLGLKPGSVSPFGLIADSDHQVKIFLDSDLIGQKQISFHPCINTASLVVSHADLIRFLEYLGNEIEYLHLDAQASD